MSDKYYGRYADDDIIDGPQIQQVTINIQLRSLQGEALRLLDKKRFGVMVCHRRFGKTFLAIMRLVRNALDPVGRGVKYRGAYIAPTYTQAKDVAWNTLKEIAAGATGKTNETELSVTFYNGAKIRLYGAENPDSLRGLDICDAVFDEVAQMPFSVWGEIVLPMLVANGGGALFIGTPKGHNTLWKIWERAKESEEWTALMYKASETKLISQADLDKAFEEMGEDKFAQEYECSFMAAVTGSYYGPIIEEMERKGQFLSIPYDRATPVITSWDLGFSDSTAIWFAQIAGMEIHIIDYYEATGVGLDHYAKVLKEKGYYYGEHLLPHDAAASELGTGTTRLETLRKLGINGTVIPVAKVEDGINAARMLLPRCWFDKDKCARGIEALKLYRREWNDKTQDFSSRPVHDWTSHASDSFRYMATGIDRLAGHSKTSFRPKRHVGGYR